MCSTVQAAGTRTAARPSTSSTVDVSLVDGAPAHHAPPRMAADNTAPAGTADNPRRRRDAVTGGSGPGWAAAFCSWRESL